MRASCPPGMAQTATSSWVSGIGLSLRCLYEAELYTIWFTAVPCSELCVQYTNACLHLKLRCTRTLFSLSTSLLCILLRMINGDWQPGRAWTEHWTCDQVNNH